MNKRILTLRILFLIVFSTIIPLSIGSNIKIPIEKEIQLTETSRDEDVDWWPMLQHDLNHSGYSTSTGPETNTILWAYQTDGFLFRSSPAIVDNKAYFGDDEKNFY